MVGPGAMASYMRSFVQNTSPDNESVVILHCLYLLLSVLLYNVQLWSSVKLKDICGFHPGGKY